MSCAFSLRRYNKSTSRNVFLIALMLAFSFTSTAQEAAPAAAAANPAATQGGDPEGKELSMRIVLHVINLMRRQEVMLLR
jgi:hypothetical protein